MGLEGKDKALDLYSSVYILAKFRQITYLPWTPVCVSETQ